VLVEETAMIFTVEPGSVEPSAMKRSRMSDLKLAMNRCYWRSRRGLLELDLLLPPFVQARFESLSEPQRLALQQLLDCEDPQIWEWLREHSVPDSPHLVELVALIRSFNADRSVDD
jgi:antitoxin CptB